MKPKVEDTLIHRATSTLTPALHLSPRATPEWNRVQAFSRSLVPEPMLCVEVSPTISRWYLYQGVGPPRPLPSTVAQSTMHLTLTTPPTGGGSTGRLPHVAHSGYAQSMGKVSTTRRSPTCWYKAVPIFSITVWLCYIAIMRILWIRNYYGVTAILGITCPNNLFIFTTQMEIDPEGATFTDSPLAS